MRVRETLKQGSWLYDGSVRARVAIVKRNYFEGPVVTDELETPGYPPTDADGCFYSIEYGIPGAGAGASGSVFGSLEEAVRHAEATLKSPIEWE
jgi:hypothetical protein